MGTKKDRPGKTAIIVGAGPAGLTAAYELLAHTGIKPIVFEESEYAGGISRTVHYKGNRIDIGGHRFFSKSDRVMDWWTTILPIQGLPDDQADIHLKYQGKSHQLAATSNGPDPNKEDNVMLVRNRLSRIYYLRRFFDYPISLSPQTVRNLGPVRIVKIGVSYIRARLFPIKNEQSLEDFFINRFGRELYLTFFKDYTEKLWGIDCREISAEWGAQRIKGLSISKALSHAVKSVAKKAKKQNIAQKDTETSLIEQFLYPKYGPGHMWERVAEIVQEKGGEIHYGKTAVGFINKGKKIQGIKVKDNATGKITTHKADYFFSTMPMKDLIASFEGEPVPANVKKIAKGLVYRDFITVGLLLDRLAISNQTNVDTPNDIVPDNWIYIQERDVKVGRLQIFNNWSPYLIKDPSTVWIGMEYFVNEGDELWSKTDEAMKEFGIKELAHIGIISPDAVRDAVVVKMKKTYPAYFGTYNKFDVLKRYVNTYENLFLIGRNGMHRYNNQDHSMLTAMVAVENIKNGIKTKDNLWKINTEKEYHEDKATS
ncbi:MAG TPA: NAD(P)/FAD-dependent oxidoreductase [Candidatus Saccharimonadales bacterium]|nr:NAD(P)/FAD-dependent oxidoreductase [Candidatus Saccharimonadales bacterium]